MGDVRRLLAGRLLRAPDAQEVVVQLERKPERPAEGAVAGDDGLVIRRQEGPGLDRRRDERRGLAADHVEVQLDAHQRIGRAGGDVDVLALAQGEAGLVVQAHEPEDRAVREAEIRQAMEGDARQAEQRVPGIDGLRDPVDRPQRRPMASLGVAVLDVVVDQAEVVPELHGGGAWQRALVFAGDAGVGEEAEERAHPLAARGAGTVQREVVADHLVQPVGGRVPVLDETDDLVLGVRDERGEIDLVRRGGHRAASVHET